MDAGHDICTCQKIYTDIHIYMYIYIYILDSSSLRQKLETTALLSEVIPPIVIFPQTVCLAAQVSDSGALGFPCKPQTLNPKPKTKALNPKP